MRNPFTLIICAGVGLAGVGCSEVPDFLRGEDAAPAAIFVGQLAQGGIHEDPAATPESNTGPVTTPSVEPVGLVQVQKVSPALVRHPGYSPVTPY